MESELSKIREEMSQWREEISQGREKLKEQEKIILQWEICDRLAQGMQVLFPETFSNGRSF